MSDFNLSKEHPAAYGALARLDEAVRGAIESAGIDAKLAELVKIRVSQLNGCAFCLRLHTRDALAIGETSDRLAVLAAWWESQYFSPVEQAALILAEEVTGLPRTRTFSGDDLLTTGQRSALTWLVIVMNAWNRVAIESHYTVQP